MCRGCEQNLDETTSLRVCCFSTENLYSTKSGKFLCLNCTLKFIDGYVQIKIRKINGIRTINVTVIWSVMQCHVVNSTVEELNASVFRVKDFIPTFLSSSNYEII